jgi:hypothetical protein
MAFQEAQGSQYLLKTLLRAPTAEFQIKTALSVLTIEGHRHISNVVALPRQAASFCLPGNSGWVSANAYGFSIRSVHWRNEIVSG